MLDQKSYALRQTLGAFSLYLLVVTPSWPQTQRLKTGRIAKIPLSFEENQGQTDSRVRFLARATDYSLFLTDSEAVLSLHAKHGTVKPDVFRMRLVDASTKAGIAGVGQLTGKSNYFIGND